MKGIRIVWCGVVGLALLVSGCGQGSGGAEGNLKSGAPQGSSGNGTSAGGTGAGGTGTGP